MGKCIFGGAILIINFLAGLGSGEPFMVSRSVANPQICQEIAKETTPFAQRFHFDTPRCLIEIPAIKGDRLR